jgi:hypothetical protein
MLNRLIYFLVRKKLGVKKGEHFQFAGQKGNTTYYFKDAYLVKVKHRDEGDIERPSNVSLNWLLDDRCVILKKGTE